MDILKIFCTFLFILHNPLYGQYILVTTLYNETRPERLAEFLYCLNQNSNDPKIKKIHVFYDQSQDNAGKKEILSLMRELKVSITYINKRPTFSQIFNLVNNRYLGEEIIIANGDIHFDETLNCLNGFDLENMFVSLTRWDVGIENKLDSHPMYLYGYPTNRSQDVWIFKTPILPFDRRGIELGVVHCDGYISYEAYKAGYHVFNPCLSIITHHIHMSGIRNWQFWPEEHPVLAVPWCSLEDIVYAGAENVYSP